MSAPLTRVSDAVLDEPYPFARFSFRYELL